MNEALPVVSYEWWTQLAPSPQWTISLFETYRMRMNIEDAYSIDVGIQKPTEFSPYWAWNVYVCCSGGIGDSRGTNQDLEGAKQDAFRVGHKLALGLLSEFPTDWSSKLKIIGEEVRKKRLGLAPFAVIQIKINGEEFAVGVDISYAMVLSRAVPKKKRRGGFIITYTNAPGSCSEGTLQPGASIKVQAGTCFEVQAKSEASI